MSGNPGGLKSSSVRDNSSVLDGSKTLNETLEFIASNSGPTNSDEVTNNSNLTGSTLSDALGNLTTSTVSDETNLTNLTLTDALGQFVPAAKGDIFVASGANTMVRLPAGLDGQILKVESGNVAWTTQSGGGSVPTGTVVFVDTISSEALQTTTSTSPQVGMSLTPSSNLSGKYAITMGWGQTTSQSSQTRACVVRLYITPDPATGTGSVNYESYTSKDYQGDHRSTNMGTVFKTFVDASYTFEIRWHLDSFQSGVSAMLRYPIIIVELITP